MLYHFFLRVMSPNLPRAHTPHHKSRQVYKNDQKTSVSCEIMLPCRYKLKNLWENPSILPSCWMFSVFQIFSDFDSSWFLYLILQITLSYALWSLISQTSLKRNFLYLRPTYMFTLWWGCRGGIIFEEYNPNMNKILDHKSHKPWHIHTSISNKYFCKRVLSLQVHGGYFTSRMYFLRFGILQRRSRLLCEM